MLKKVARKLDKWIEEENRKCLEEGRPRISFAEIKVIGQTALIEAELSFSLTATMDVDCHNRLTGIVKEKFDEFLKEEGKFLDPHGPEAWMPGETSYNEFYSGKFIKVLLAAPVYIMVSKAKTAFNKNQNLLAEYIASEDFDQNFFDLIEKYQIDLSGL